MEDIKWWEKTVEYNFVLNAEKDYGINLLSPFDGNVESIGDALVGCDSSFFIIEFKKALSNFSSEYDKYKNGKDGFENARIEMMKLAGWQSHYAIGGVYEEEEKRLGINVKYYFDVENKKIPDNLFFEGMNADELLNYTINLTALKKPDSGSDDSGGRGLRHSSVLAIDKNKQATIISLDYYAQLKLTKKQALTRTPGMR